MEWAEGYCCLVPGEAIQLRKTPAARNEHRTGPGAGTAGEFVVKAAQSWNVSNEATLRDWQAGHLSCKGNSLKP